MVLPMGPDFGTGYFNGNNVPSIMVKVLKAKDLFNSRFWGEMGQKVPK